MCVCVCVCVCVCYFVQTSNGCDDAAFNSNFSENSYPLFVYLTNNVNDTDVVLRCCLGRLVLVDLIY